VAGFSQIPEMLKKKLQNTCRTSIIILKNAACPEQRHAGLLLKIKKWMDEEELKSRMDKSPD